MKKTAKVSVSERRARAPKTAAARKPGKRGQGAARRAAILAAALDEFSASGFAATRLDDVARRAGVAKGTIYLYFKDKESLFQELLRSELSPVVSAIELLLDAVPRGHISIHAIADRVVDLLVEQVLQTRRKDIIRLIIAEGTRFPKLAEFYYREVISRGMTAMRLLMQRAADAGELNSDAVVRFPQLLIAPALVAVIWQSMFEKFEPLDAKALMHAHVDILFGERRAA